MPSYMLTLSQIVKLVNALAEFPPRMTNDPLVNHVVDCVTLLAVDGVNAELPPYNEAEAVEEIAAWKAAGLLSL